MSADHWSGTPVRRTSEINGAAVPLCFETIESEVRALRESVALSDISHTAIIKISGAGADPFIDRILPCIISLKPNQMRQTLLINEQAKLFADVYICRDQNEWYILAHGVRPDVLAEWLKEQAADAGTVSLEPLNASHTLLSVNGPFAWELMSETEEPEIISLPYLSFYRPDERRMIFRAGETGEFGYHLLVEKDKAPSLWKQISDCGKEFGMRYAGWEAIAYCMLENNFFNIYLEGQGGETPAELQVQWRVSYEKEFAFSPQLAVLHKRPLLRRLTSIHAASEPFQHAKISYENKTIGRVLHGHRFLSGSGWIGLAMIDMPWAVSGVTEYTAIGPKGPLPLRTVSSPFVNNRSLYIDPQLHTFREPEGVKFPALSALE